MKQVFSDDFLELKRRTSIYNKAIRSACDKLPRGNKELYRLILRDLIYHFEPTRAAPTRARAQRGGEMWTVDSYEEIAKRINKLLKKPVSARTLQRYHADMIEKGWLICERHMFAGKNTLHRRLDTYVLENELLVRFLNNAIKEQKEHEQDPHSDDIQLAVEKARNEAKGQDPAEKKSPKDIEVETEMVIRMGDLLFGLGLLNNKRKKVTRWARTRIQQLVEGELLSVDAIYALKDAWEKDAFKGMVEMKTKRYNYWPDWLFDFYPQDRAICRGLAAYWFLEAEPSGHPWLKGDRLKRYLSCQDRLIPMFERLNQSYRSEPQPADYVAWWHDGVVDDSRTKVYFNRMHPGQDMPEEILSSSKA